MRYLVAAACLLIVAASPLTAFNGSDPAPARAQVNVPLPIYPSRTAVGNLNAMVIFLADQLVRNCDVSLLSKPAIVTSFPRLDNLKETSGLGRLIAENLMHELQVRKWKLIDIRLVQEVIINDNGEFSLSRDISKVREQYHVGAVITGTYSITNTSVVINARVLDLDTATVVSSGQAVVPVTGIEALLYITAPRTMKITGD